MDVDAPPPVEPYNPFANRMKSSSGPGGASTRSDGRTLTERVPPATAPAADYISLDGAELYSRGGSRTSSRAFPSMSNLSVIDDDEANNSVLFADDGGANMGPIDGRDGSGDLSDDQSDDDNDEERDREEAELREHELEIIRRGGGMAGRTSLAAKAKRAVRAIEREADLRLPEIPTIQSFPTALASATSQLAKEREWLDSHAAQMAAAAAELEKLELADVDADADLLELATLHAQAESLRNDVQDMLEMAADMGPTLSTWEADWDALAASEVGANQLVTVQQERVRGAFDELRVDLAHLPTVLARFAGYRASDRDGYRRSLAAEVIPVVVAPHVRADLLSWDPLSPAVPAQPIEERVWHAAVVAYGSGDVRVQNPNDPDVAIVRHVTVDYVVPALMSRIRAVPPSAWSGVPAVRRKWQDLLEEVLYVVDKSDEAFQVCVFISLFVWYVG
ncbi:hypothetical protein BC828DRAFT_372624 [Blastocladiella britannica]|nr:hypothetical protein BC828DRAFT_372624 [Blastocladiella britannica]